MQPLGFVRQQRHHLALENRRDVLHRHLQNLLNSPRAGQLPAEGMHDRGLTLLQTGSLGLPFYQAGQMTDDHGDQKHHHEGHDVLGIFHRERPSGRDKREIKGENAEESIEDRGPSPALHSGAHHRQQIHHDQVGQVQVGIHQEADAGSHSDIDQADFIVRPPEGFRLHQNRRLLVFPRRTGGDKDIDLAAQTHQIVHRTLGEEIAPAVASRPAGHDLGDLPLACEADNLKQPTPNLL
ncbi:MAG TPA: hypothetical protein VMW56_09845 [Candidatus Margulisiibacteriota bacterium]|nr:hypothetical protein [Candidatus Margulisiibacteriota bacterium]